MASDEERENYRELLNGFDFYRAGIQGLRVRLARDIQDACRRNCSPELFEAILRKMEWLQKADAPTGTAAIEGTLIAHGIEIGEIAVQ
ncbi:MAG: hypothetical protein A2945_00370 [Candidatus Liptonbacteria bacterium RIFCSPLOWO2_01_FULL_52_25]|uniref:Uncharacterized protein n=1 Tax=Candidatus Liptonbacteria bacterium RIFCSPLOWO2_01_FULL_52_25 TaxID=1798650 RepID=A0A1G2CG03_9BACT|nr:MAG: hypothetical protein A2945_00370 [Candidatus Liptonbacteria bacterium RIFCSPLOWO2_01_FULL_52_25]